MGSSSSKDAADRVRSKGTRVFRSSCLGRSFASASSSDNNEDQVSSHQSKENGRLKDQTCIDENGIKSCQPNGERFGKVKTPQPNLVPSSTSYASSDEWHQESITPIDSGAGSSSTQTVVARSSSPLSRSRSRFSFIPGSLSFRLNRAASLGSSRPCSLFSTSVSISNTEEGFHVHNVSDSSDDRNEAHERSQLDLQASGLSAYLPNADTLSSEDAARNTSQRNHMETENTETRRPDRQFGSQEPMEGSVRFSRTLSVGRLRDRVLRRTSFSDRLFGQLQEDRAIGETRQGGSRPFWSSVTRASSSDRNSEIPPTSSSYHLSSTSTSTNSSSQDFGVETQQLRESTNHDLLEQRTAFLERRRRIRSQVRALQRLGSRSESLSGHDRSCILSGQHRTGRCRCRTSSRPSNPDDDTGARASISRIVMLAEALFEVLDEIHQQSVVLSSRPSVSSIGSVPAPKEVVECMPVKMYTKSHKHQNDEAAQCYICLVEYEEGDCMRILPCHHEFHQTCIDKWLKEIHRVCPLCRGDVCRSDLPLMEKAD